MRIKSLRRFCSLFYSSAIAGSIVPERHARHSLFVCDKRALLARAEGMKDCDGQRSAQALGSVAALLAGETLDRAHLLPCNQKMRLRSAMRP